MIIILVLKMTKHGSYTFYSDIATGVIMLPKYAIVKY